MTSPRQALDDLRRRAREGALTPDERHAVIGHMQRGNADPVRAAAISVAAACIETRADAELVVELIKIAESKDAADDAVRTDAVRALAKATEYKGQPVRFEL